MIGIDTNILVRYLTQDDPAQSNLANQLFERTIDSGKVLWISQITLCETIWVLKKCYKLPKEEILYIMQEILLIPQINIEHAEATRLALKDFEMHTNVGFADCLIGRQNATNGCEITYTLDKAAAKQLSAVYKPLVQ